MRVKKGRMNGSLHSHRSITEHDAATSEEPAHESACHRMRAVRRTSAALRCSPSLGPRIFRRGVGEVGGLEAISGSGSSRRKPTGWGDPLAESQSPGRTIVDSYTTGGFVVNGVTLQGAVLLLPTHSMLFRLAHLDDLTPRSLEILRLLEERTDMLVIGCGRQLVRPPLSVREWTAEHRIATEISSTPHACSTFNFMVQEHRQVATVLFPVGGSSEA